MGTLADLAESGDADALSAAIADGAHLDEADDEGNTATHPPENPSSERRLRYCAGRLRLGRLLHHKVSNDLASRLSVLFELVCLSRRAISPGLRT